MKHQILQEIDPHRLYCGQITMGTSAGVVAAMMILFDVDCFGGRPFPAVFRADFLGSMISHLYSAIMIWGSRNIKIVNLIF